MIPYPGRHESHDSWMRRCAEYERAQDRRRKEQAARSSKWGGYNYRPIKNDVTYVREDGTRIAAVKVGEGSGNLGQVRRYALKHALAYFTETVGRGLTMRTDGVAYVAPDYDQYNNDDH